MKKKILFFMLLSFCFSCTNTSEVSFCFQQFNINVVRNLSLPELNSAQVPGGFAILANEGRKGILLLNVNGNNFIAYDLLCPNGFCNQPMSFDGGFTLTCSCDGSTYGIGTGIGGAPQTNGFDCPAIEYRVIKIGNTIRITNF